MLDNLIGAPPADKRFVVNAPVGDSELLLCHGSACVVRECVI